MKDQVRPIYSELQGYLSQAPSFKDQPWTTEQSIWNQYNGTVDELNKVFDQEHKYDRFKIIPSRRGDFISIDMADYRNKLGGLISRLHAEYFSDEPAPFSGMPSTIITQHQVQNQSTYVQILLDIQSKIDEKLKEHKDGSKEKTFLEKIKSSLSKVGNISDLLSLILKTGVDAGLTIEQVWKLFT